MSHIHYTKSKHIIDSYYSIRKPQQGLGINQKFLTPSKILLSARKQSVQTTTNIKAAKTRNSATYTEPHELSLTRGNLSSMRPRNTRLNTQFTQHVGLLSQSMIEQPDYKDSLLKYQKLYQISIRDLRRKDKQTIRSKSMQKSSLKDRTDNRFDQTFTKIVNPKFNEKLKLFRRIHISISQHEQSNHQQNYSANVKSMIGMCQSPGNRQGCSVLLIDKKLYVIGGKSTNYEHSIQYLDCRKNEWMKTMIIGYQRRSFHSCLLYEDHIYLICGYKEPRWDQDQRKLTSEVEIINLKTKGIIKYKLSSCYKRYGHSAIVYKDSVLITGGINQQGEFLSEGLQFSLKTKKTIKLQLHQDLQKGIAYHSTCKGQFGIYLFGGMTLQKILNKNIYFYNGFSQFTKLIAFGKPPSPCLNPNIQYLPKLNSIVIYGGTTTQKYPTPIRQLFVFSQSKHTYTEVLRINSVGQFGYYCNGASTHDTTSMYIFGGFNQKEFNQKLYRLDFDFI